MKPEELIEIEAAQTDSSAFESVFGQYLPMVMNTLRPYYLRDYSREDWLQEARIALIKALRRYDSSRGSKFGPYYRLVLVSHLRSLLRRYLAQKRQADRYAVVTDMTGDHQSSAELGWHEDPEAALMLKVMFVQDFLPTLNQNEQVTLERALSATVEPRDKAFKHQIAMLRDRLVQVIEDSE